MTTILNQQLTKRDLDYLDSEDQDAVMVVRDRKTGVITTSTAGDTSGHLILFFCGQFRLNYDQKYPMGVCKPDTS